MSAPSAAVTRIRTWVASATTKSTNHYTITAIEPWLEKLLQFPRFKPVAYALAAFGSAGPRPLGGIGKAERSPDASARARASNASRFSRPKWMEDSTVMYHVLASGHFSSDLTKGLGNLA